jgi:glycosyltransferase involved in cell wall biosynthesis
MIRVAHLNSLLTGGGTDDQCVKLAAGLRAAGVDALLVGPEGRPFSRIARELAVPLRATPREGPLKLGFILAAARAIRGHRAQIVHGHHGRDLWPTVLAARLSGVRPRILITRHLAKSPGSAFSRRFLLNRLDAMICVSEFTARVLREGHRDPTSPEIERHWRPPMSGDLRRLTVIHGGIDTQRFRPMDPADAAPMRERLGLVPGDFAFGVVGGFAAPRGKGQREFLRAASRIAGRLRQARFLIVGQGSLETTLRGDIESLGLTGRAWLAGQQSDMPAVMNALDCLVHPQIGTESLGLVVCEAHACGRPVIASDLDGIPEAFAPGALGRLVPAEDVPGLAEAMMVQAGEAPPSWEERHRVHGRVAKAFSLERLAAEHVDLYRRWIPEG